VLPGLYVGNYQDSKDADQLERFEITHILAIHDTARRLHSVSAESLSGMSNTRSKFKDGKEIISAERSTRRSANKDLSKMHPREKLGLQLRIKEPQLFAREAEREREREKTFVFQMKTGLDFHLNISLLKSPLCFRTSITCASWLPTALIKTCRSTSPCVTISFTPLVFAAETS